eukprot:TRINITY_DN38572_c0_g1_i1.p1 TRINITY_DN38572_c0_g1~~TRINITY_DN38572_c0_g1_i1.p1  ORF type:complete len:575 (-),score=185.49 TRINITY_DN38572_c0_g1_i1:96-1787(-)
MAPAAPVPVSRHGGRIRGADDSTDDSEEDWDEELFAELAASAPRDAKAGGGAAARGGYSGGGDAAANAAVRNAVMQKLQARINFDILPHSRGEMSQAATNSILASERKAGESRNLGLTKEARATVEQVLDQRTMLVLGKFMKRGLFAEIHGCISTGKEANVYYATAPEGVERAVKIYKTSILVFKDRARYVEGEYRFRHGYTKGNPRKMVAQWAEKEMRNLKRLESAGIRCPSVVEVRQNVLVMDFIGIDGEAAPRLKDTENLSPADWSAVYRDCVGMMRKMMQECRLVHGDLSEYNMLYKAGELVIIDVSQSVERDHPQALEFLKRDCINVNNFFGKRVDCALIPVKRLFDFVVTKEPNINGKVYGSAADADGTALDALFEEAEEKDGDEENLVNDEVFVQTWIPSSLNQVSDRNFIEKEIERHQRGEEMLYERLLVDNELPRRESEEEDEDEDEEDEQVVEEKKDKKKKKAPASEKDKPAVDKAKKADDEEASGESSGSEDGEDDDEEGDGDGKVKDGRRPDGMSKAEWKALVKEEQREKRKDKIPKALKKRYRKQAAKGR